MLDEYDGRITEKLIEKQLSDLIKIGKHTSDRLSFVSLSRGIENLTWARPLRGSRRIGLRQSA